MTTVMAFNVNAKGNDDGHLKKNISEVLRSFVPFLQFKNLEKQPWRSVNFSKVVR